MTFEGKWEKDEDGYIHFDPDELFRYYEVVTELYYNKYDDFLQRTGDEDKAGYEAANNGYKLLTHDKKINGKDEFCTSYITPSWEMDLWYEYDQEKGKRDFDKGYVRINKKK